MRTCVYTIVTICIGFVFIFPVESSIAGQILEEDDRIEPSGDYSSTQRNAVAGTSSSTSETIASPSTNINLKQAVKNSGRDYVTSLINETIRNLGDNINQSLRENNLYNVPRLSPYDSISTTPSPSSQYVPSPLDDGRRQKPSRWKQ